MMLEHEVNILIVDDDLKIADLLKIHLLSAGKVACKTVPTAEEGLVLFEEQEFDVVISDLRMPGMGGMEFLSRVDEIDSRAVKVLFTGFGDLNSLHGDMQQVGISYFISKPWQKAQISIVMDSIFKEIGSRREINSLNEELVLLRSNAELLNSKIQKNYYGSVSLLRDLIQQTSPTIANHCRRTSILVTNLSRRMGKPQDYVERAQIAAFLHDLSVMSYPSHIHQGLESYMSGIEKSNYVKHPEICANLLGQLEDFSSLAEIVRYHHENVDGSGFYGVFGEDLSDETKMIRICDCYDEEETYNRRAHQKTLDYMKMFRGKWFDGEIFDEFYEMMNSFKK